MTLLQIIKGIKPERQTYASSFETFVNAPEFEYVIWDEYPIYTNHLIPALKRVFENYLQTYEERIEDDPMVEEVLTYLRVNDTPLEFSVDELRDLLDTPEFRQAEHVEIKDVCGGNYGSGIYCAE